MTLVRIRFNLDAIGRKSETLSTPNRLIGLFKPKIERPLPFLCGSKILILKPRGVKFIKRLGKGNDAAII